MKGEKYKSNGAENGARVGSALQVRHIVQIIIKINLRYVVQNQIILVVIKISCHHHANHHKKIKRIIIIIRFQASMTRKRMVLRIRPLDPLSQ